MTLIVAAFLLWFVVSIVAGMLLGALIREMGGTK